MFYSESNSKSLSVLASIFSKSDFESDFNPVFINLGIFVFLHFTLCLHSSE